jgi:hypothetical protein
MLLPRASGWHYAAFIATSAQPSSAKEAAFDCGLKGDYVEASSPNQSPGDEWGDR